MYRDCISFESHAIWKVLFPVRINISYYFVNIAEIYDIKVQMDMVS